MQNTFTIKEALSFGWQKTKENWTMFLLISIVYNIVSGIPEIYSKIFKITGSDGQILPNVPFPMMSSYAVISLFFIIISIILSYNQVKLNLQMNDGFKVKLSELFKFENGQGKKVVKYFFGSLAFGLLIFFGLILLIIPGIYVMFTYMFVPYLLVDKNVSIKEAFRLSKEAANGNKKQLALMALTSFGVALLGLLAFVVGVVPAMIIISFASTYIYRKLTNKTI